MKINVRDEIKIPEPTRQELEEKVKFLEAKVKRLQQSKFDKAAMMAMQGICSRGVPMAESQRQEVAEVAIKQAKALIDALNEDGE